MRRNERDAHRDLCDRADWLDTYLPEPAKADRFIFHICLAVCIGLLVWAAIKLWSA